MEAFPELFLVNAPLPKADAPLSSYLRSVSIALYTWRNTVVFLRMALRRATRTLFSFQGATDLFYHKEEQPEMQGLKPTRIASPRWRTRLTTGAGSPVACGGLSSVKMSEFDGTVTH